MYVRLSGLSGCLQVGVDVSIHFSPLCGGGMWQCGGLAKVYICNVMQYNVV